MNAADLILKMTEAGATSAVIAIVVAAIKKSSGNLPEFSGMSPEKELEIWRKIEAVRKRKTYKPRRKHKAKAEANDAALGAKNGTEKSPEKVGDGGSSSLLTSLPFLTSEEATKEESKKGRGVTRARGTRLVEGMPLTDEYRLIAIAEGLTEPASVWTEFVNYWCAVPGHRGLKTNWRATWRNNVRKVFELRGKSHGYRNGSAPRTELQSSLDKVRDFARRSDRAEPAVSQGEPWVRR